MTGTVSLILIVVMIVMLPQGMDSRFGTWPDVCLENHSKDTPTKEIEEFPACRSWQDLSCCSVNKTRDLQENGSIGTRIVQGACGNFSEKCMEYMLASFCFYHCEPMIWHYQHPHKDFSPHQVPICGSYCDEWYDACKDDKTCVNDWIVEFYEDPDSRDCPVDQSKCITYADMYGDSKGMCNNIFSTNFYYEESNKDCMVMIFDGDNPNHHGNPYGSASKVTSSLLANLLGFWLLYNCL